MVILGLVPARAGSVGVPQKNKRPLAGKPLVAHTIEAALESRIDRVVLSTDSEEIAAIGRQFGAETPFMRPAPLASATATAIAVVQHCLEWLDRIENWCPDAVFYLQPTSPFRTAHHIDQALALLGNRDSVMSVAPVKYHPSEMWQPTEEGSVAPFATDRPRFERRQDYPPLYTDNNAIILSRTRYLLSQDPATGLVVNYGNFNPYPIEGAVAVDIDAELDFRFAEFLMARECERD